MRSTARVSGFLILSAGVAAVAACAEVEVLPPSPEIRAEIGAIAITAHPFETSGTIETPVKGKGAGAAMGAGQGAVGSLAGGASVCQAGEPLSCVLGLALGIAAAPVAAVVGAGVGGSRAHSEDEVLVADANLRGVLDEMSLHEALREAVAARIAGDTGHRVVDPGAGGSGSAPSPKAATRLEIGGSFQVHTEGRIDPDLTLVLGTRARLVRTEDNLELYRRSWGYLSPTRGYFELAADGAEPLRAELRGAVASLAEKMVADLFVTTETEVYRPGATKPGVARAIDAQLGALPATDLLARPAETGPDGASPGAAAPDCAGSSDPDRPWVGEWRAKFGKAELRLNIGATSVTGELRTPSNRFPVSGGVTDSGQIEMTANGIASYERADITGRFPTLRLASGGSSSRSFDLVDGAVFDLCP